MTFPLLGNSKIENYLINDSNEVKNLIIKSLDLKFINSQESIKIGKRGAKLAQKLNYKDGLAESYRAIGVGFSYLDKRDSSLNYYFKALNIYKESKNKLGEAKVYNNLGNIFSEFDNNKSLEYYYKSLSIASRLKDGNLIAGCYLNIGNIFHKQNNYKKAVSFFKKSNNNFITLNNTNGIMLSLQNWGVCEFKLKNYKRAENLLLQAYTTAKENNFITSIASINITLASINTQNDKFKEAELYIKEGLDLSHHAKDSKLIYDLTLTYYELEKKIGNTKKALELLESVHDQDSIKFRDNIISIINLTEEQQNQQRKQKEYELAQEKQKNTATLFIASVIVIILSLILIFILIRSKQKTEKTNEKLIKLNAEVSQQKDNLDRINSRLEEIIEDRTKDLIIKNRKLSEYSSHLSHQVRGPVATLKGLIMLSQDNLIEEKECITQMKKCVDDIDDQIMDINIALHDPDRKGLGKKNS